MKFWVPGKPQGKARARTVNNGGRVHSYTPERTALYENLIKVCFEQAKPADWEPFPKDTPIKATVKAYFPIPKSVSKKRHAAMEGAPHTKKCDIDNLLKIVFDSLNGVAYVDDSAICQVEASKLYSSSPGVEVCLESIGENSP